MGRRPIGKVAMMDAEPTNLAAHLDEDQHEIGDAQDQNCYLGPFDVGSRRSSRI